MNTFFITNIPVHEINKEKYKKLDFSSILHVYYQGECFHNDDWLILIDGFAVPRNNIYKDYSTLNQFELIKSLFEKYNSDFIKYIKGFYNILIAHKNKIVLVNDIHSVKRFYSYKQGGEFIITNQLSLINQNNPFSFNSNAPVLMATLQHFVQGDTMFENVNYSTPSTYLSIENNKINQYEYLDRDHFANLPKIKYTAIDFQNVFIESINNYIKYLEPENISTTLTGGRDTRSILAALIQIGVNPHCFTFGYPSGIDVITSENICKKCDLPFSNYYINPLNKSTYDLNVKEIITISNPFIHIHRAHRLDAIKKHNQSSISNNKMVFIGAMGGDYIMGEHFNDYILTEFLRRYITGKENEEDLFKDIFSKHFVLPTAENIELVKNRLKSLDIQKDRFDKNTEYRLVHSIIGSTHDIQDINVFLNQVKYVIAPFMDIDVMETLFSSGLSLFSNNRHTKNPFKRLKGGELQCSLIKKFAPELADIPFTNQYTPNDVLGNQLFYVLKRIYLQTSKAKSTPTFTYDDWFKEYVNTQINNIDPTFDKYYNLDKMKNEIKSKFHQTHEGYWHKYSNPIMFDLYLKSFNY